MSRSFWFTVPGLPIAQPRQRHRVISDGVRTFATNYTPAKSPVNVFKASVQLAAAATHVGPPHVGPVGITAIFVMPRPKAMVWKTKPMPRVSHCIKPDIDNLLKAVTDALKGIIYSDDSLICFAWAWKVIASGDEQPHCDIQVTLVEFGDANLLPQQELSGCCDVTVSEIANETVLSTTLRREELERR